MKEDYDILLLSPWTEEIKVSPMFHIMRKEIEKCSNILFKQKLPEFSEIENEMGKNVLQYYEKIPISTGLLSIAAVLLDKGYKVKYISLDYYKDKTKTDWLECLLRDELKNTRYMVCVTSVTPEIYRALKIIDLVKEIKSSLITVIGGTHVSYLDEDYAKYENIDFVSRGEGEYTILELLEAVVNHDTNFEDIDGLSFVKNGEFFRTKERAICDLELLPDAAYDLLPAKDRDKFKYHTYFSRGCYNNCDYCVEGKFFGAGKRYRKVDRFVDELEKFSKVYKWRYIHIFDSDFIQGNPYINDICDEIARRKLNIILSINSSPKLYKMIDKKLLKKMVDVGFKEFLIGSETADDKLISSLNRHQTYDDLLHTTKMLKEVGAPIVSTYWVVGLPGETRDSLLNTIKSVDYLFKNDLIYHGSAKLFVPYPGTKVNRYLEECGIHLVNNDWTYYDRYNFPPPYINENISVFELYEFMNLFHAMQLSYFVKRANRIYDSYFDNLENIKSSFSNAIYL